ncbi:hypothetical protein HZS_5001 [Henneguya salminicola]|nr:hypothetical protein HZS_5001 [Henneguya salminicola]
MDSNDFVSTHSQLFKNTGKSFDSIRKERQTKTIELRKSRRDELIQKKRNQFMPQHEVKASGTIVSIEQIEKLVQDCARNIVDILASHLGSNETHEVRYNSTWALTNIASGSSEHTAYLLKDHIILALGRLLNEHNPSLVEQSVWAISNIMGDGPAARSFVLRSNILSILPQVLRNNGQNPIVMKQFSWMLINVCRKKEADVNIEYVPQIIPLILAVLEIKEDSILSDALWAITHLADSSHNHITLMINGGLVEKILPLFNCNQKLALSAIRAAGNIAASIDEHTQYLLDHSIYQYIAPLLSCTNQKIRKVLFFLNAQEVYWLLSNIAAGTRAQMLTLFSLNIFHQIIRDLEQGEYSVQREACWIISNVLHSSTIEEAQPFIESKVLFFMKKFLISKDTPMIIVVVEVLLILLRLYTSHNKQQYICEKIEESGMLDCLEDLQSNSNKTINNFVIHILDKYFSEDNEIIENPKVYSAPTHPETETTSTLPQTRYNF